MRLPQGRWSRSTSRTTRDLATSFLSSFERAHFLEAMWQGGRLSRDREGTAPERNEVALLPTSAAEYSSRARDSAAVAKERQIHNARHLFGITPTTGKDHHGTRELLDAQAELLVRPPQVRCQQTALALRRAEDIVAHHVHCPVGSKEEAGSSIARLECAVAMKCTYGMVPSLPS